MNEIKEILKYTYQRRHSLNARYSQNAFARDLKISPTALSQFLSNKRNLSPRNLKNVISSLYLEPEIIQRTKNPAEASFGFKIQSETFNLIAEWYHFGILNLCEVENVRSANQAARRLGIQEDLAKKAIYRLTSLGLLQSKQGTLRRTHKTLDAGTEIPSEALRKHNREKMELAIESLEMFPVNERDISSLTLTFDRKKIQKIKKEIQKFKKRIQSLCQAETPSEVYSLNVQFFPLSKGNSK